MLSSKRTKSFPPCQTSFPLSADIIANNEDLLTEILLHLPMKSILKFKCVSKHWLALISNPTFSRRHKPYVSSPSGLFLLSYYRPQTPDYQFVSLESSHSNAPFKCLTFVNDPSDIKVIQSCNGLLLCCTNRARRPFYYVYNPTTKQYTILPRARRVLGVTLAFDPSKSPHYKAICVCKCDSLRDHYQIEIYSSNTGPWRVSGSPFTTEGYVDFNGGEFCDGAIYWFNNSDDTCLCFDVDQEQLKQVPMPQIPQNPDDWDQRNAMYFGASRGHLHFVMIHGHRDNTQLDVYEMKRDYSGWFVKFRIDVDVVAIAFPEIIKSSFETWESSCYSFEIMSVVQGESDEDSFSVLRIPGKVIRYDFKDKGLTELCDFTPNGMETGQETASNFTTVHVYQYIECLACV